MQKFIVVTILLLTLASMVEFPRQSEPKLQVYFNEVEAMEAPTAFENLLGLQIQNIRKEKGFSVAELAHMLETPAPTITLIENGAINPSETFISEFQYILGCKLFLGT